MLTIFSTLFFRSASLLLSLSLSHSPTELRVDEKFYGFEYFLFCYFGQMRCCKWCWCWCDTCVTITTVPYSFQSDRHTSNFNMHLIDNFPAETDCMCVCVCLRGFRCECVCDITAAYNYMLCVYSATGKKGSGSVFWHHICRVFILLFFLFGYFCYSMQWKFHSKRMSHSHSLPAFSAALFPMDESMAERGSQPASNQVSRRTSDWVCMRVRLIAIICGIVLIKWQSHLIHCICDKMWS